MPITLPTVKSGYNLGLINDNFQTIEDAWDEKLDRLVSTQGNFMEQTLDMNSNEIINTKVTDNPTSLVTKEYVDALFNAIDGAEGIVPIIENRQQGDGVTTLFNSPATEQAPAASFFIQIDGITQRPITDFNATGSGKISFTEAPPLLTDVDITYFEPANLGDVLTEERLPELTNLVYDTVADMVAAFEKLKVGTVVTTKGYYAEGDEGAARYLITSGNTGDGYLDHNIGDNTATLQYQDELKIRQCGAKGDGTTDDWDAINTALQTYRPVALNTGVFAVSQTVRIRENQHLRLGEDVTLVMPLSLTSDLDPVVWLGSPFGTVKGPGQRNAYIRKESPCPDGVVKLGMQNMQESTNNCFQCELSGVTLYGPQLYGQTSGNPDIGLHMPSPELQPSHFNYFHRINNIGIEDVNTGIWLRGWANGNFIQDIYGVHIGNASLRNEANMIWVQGALDNNISNIFFNQSDDSTGITVENLDNIGNGSPQIMTASYNTFRGIVLEHSFGIGTQALGLDIRASQASHYEVIDNVFNGNAINEQTFINSNNTLIATTRLYSPESVSKSTKARDFLTVGTTQDLSSAGMNINGANANVSPNYITSDNSTTALLNYTNGTGNSRWLDLRYDGSFTGVLGTDGAGRIHLTNADNGLKLFDGFVAPSDANSNIIDGAYDLGVISGRFKDGYFVNTPVGSSDRNEKTDEKEIPVHLLNAALELKQNVKIWKWLSRTESPLETEGDNARFHIGPMAQDIVDIFEKHMPEGDSVWNYGFICKDDTGRLMLRPVELLWLIIAAG